MTVFEGDSLVGIKALQRGNMLSSSFAHLISNTSSFVSSLRSFSFSHTLRQGNVVAYALTQRARIFFFCWFEWSLFYQIQTIQFMLIFQHIINAMDDLFLQKKKKNHLYGKYYCYVFFFFVKLNILYNYFDFHLYRKFIREYVK